MNARLFPKSGPFDSIIKRLSDYQTGDVRGAKARPRFQVCRAKSVCGADGFFYPHVAATQEGIVLVGQSSRHPASSITRLVHVDWDGRLLHQEDLPRGVGEAECLAYDVRPGHVLF